MNESFWLNPSFDTRELISDEYINEFQFDEEDDLNLILNSTGGLNADYKIISQVDNFKELEVWFEYMDLTVEVKIERLNKLISDIELMQYAKNTSEREKAKEVYQESIELLMNLSKELEEIYNVWNEIEDYIYSCISCVDTIVQFRIKKKDMIYSDLSRIEIKLESCEKKLDCTSFVTKINTLLSALNMINNEIVVIQEIKCYMVRFGEKIRDISCYIEKWMM